MQKSKQTLKNQPAESTRVHTEMERAQRRKRELILGLGAILAFVILSLGFLTALNPAMRWAVVGALVSAKGERPLDLTVVHTNDTWGYVLPCG
ncbi:MAG: hypothetical protein JXA74_17390 [Anaerolineae bacterium]|nr:hypothetical protein [Anaerolineae bacterium]